MRHEAEVPIALEAPLRPFRPGDEEVVARLNDMASGGLVLTVWQQMETDGDPWAFGYRRQLERMNSGQVMVVCDPGDGVEAVLMGNPETEEPTDPLETEPEFRALVELENMVPGTWYLNVLATLPEARGKGHASRLLTVAEEIARAGGHDAISLIASDANDLALPLYQKFGYGERARRPMTKGAWDGPGSEWILMVKTLA